MKNYFTRSASFMAILMMAFGIAGCVEKEPVEEPDEPAEKTESVFEVALKSVDQMSAEISVKSENIEEAVYVLRTEEAQMTDHAVMFKNGTPVDLGAETFKIEGLEANKTYWAYFAARINSEEYFEDILSLEIKTPDYEFKNLLTLVETDYQGYSVRITVPESVRKEPEKYGIRFSFGSLADVLDAKYGMNETWAANLINNGHGCMGWQETQRDTTVTINPENEYRLDENGEYVVDKQSGEMIYLHAPIAPGEPYIFVAGEYRYGDIGENGWGWTYGSPEKDMGYFIPLWDQDAWIAEKGPDPKREDIVLDVENGLFLSGEEEYWEGALQPLFFRTKLPGELETDLEIRIEETSPINAWISVIPDDNVYCYSYFICNDALYNQLVSDVLLGHEEWLQWFVCSYYAMRSFSTPTVSGPAELVASKEVGAYLDPENVYHILVTATSDEYGSKQKFFHETFETTAKVLDPPVIKVTAVEDGQNEYFAKFNIKAPNKDVVSAAYGANYKRDFIIEHNAGTSYDALAQNAFSAEELKQINSDEGFEIWINSTDGETTRLVVVGYNEENTRNEVYSPEKVGPCEAVADCSTKLLDMVPRVNSPLFDDLEGTWTASAKLMVRDYDDNQNLVEYITTSKTKVEIMNSYDLPALTDEIYAVYEQYGMGKDAVDMLYEDLGREVEIFNNYRLIYRNRLLCLGWFDYDYYDPSRLETKTPFDLFGWEAYNSYNNAQLIYDFGPKWYLEVAADGSVTVPFDQWETPPMTNWQGTPFFMSAYAHSENGKTLNHGYKIEVAKESTGEVYMPGQFPVEVVSKDKIIVRPVKAALDTTAATVADANLYNHYPNAIGGWGAYDAQIIRPVVSEITLTRGWTEKENSSAVRRTNCVERIDITGEDVMKVTFKSMTPMPERKEKQPFRKVRPIFYPTDEAYEMSLRNLK